MSAVADPLARSRRVETAAETRATCALVLLGDLAKFAALKEYAESLGMRIIYQRSTAPWIHLYVTTKKQFQDWREGQ